MPIQAVWIAWWVFWTVASINIVNFMDGIDGMIASQGVVYGFFLYALLPSEFFGSRFGLILAAACLGFLLWNWAPAKIFLGDVGSGPLGLFFAIGGALALDGAPAILVFLPLFPLFLDALLTMIIRVRNGQMITESHRDHLYQRIANGGKGHAVVTATYSLAAAIGAVVAIWVKDAPTAWRTGAVTGYVVTVILVWRVMDKRYALGQQESGTPA